MMKRLRDRTRNWQGTTTLTDYWDGIPYPVSYRRSSTLLQSRIQDITGNPRGKNDVYHVKTDWSDVSWSLAPAQDPNDAHRKYGVHVGSDLAHYARVPSIGEIIPDFSDVMEQLYNDAIGGIDLKVNLVVNAIEIASLKELVPQIFKIGGNIMKQGLGRKSLKELANGHLLYSFGIVPLVTDIKALLNIRSTVKKRIAQLERRNGRTVRLTGRLPPFSASSDSIAFASGSPHTQQRTYHYVSTVSGAVSCDVAGFFVPGPQSAVKLWGQALGLATPLQSCWEIIPFSFVFDWFLPIGDSLTKLESKILPRDTVNNVSLSNFCYSIKTVTNVTSSVKVIQPCWSAWEGKTWPGISGTITKYTRAAGVAPASGERAPIGWSFAKSALSVSLIAQKVLK